MIAINGSIRLSDLGKGDSCLTRSRNRKGESTGNEPMLVRASLVCSFRGFAMA